MTASRWHGWGLVAALVVGDAAHARECEGVYAECKDDCSLQYGSIQVEMKKRFAKCMKRCDREAARCTEQEVEAESNHLDPGALEKSPASSDVDSEGMPTRGADSDGEENATRRSRVSSDQEAGTPKKAKAKGKGTKKRPPVEDSDSEGGRDEAPARREALREDDVPKSSRTELKTDEKPDKPTKKPQESSAEATRSDAPKAKEADPPRTKKPPPDEPVSSGAEDERPRKESTKARGESSKPPPAPKKEDDDDLKNF